MPSGSQVLDLNLRPLGCHSSRPRAFARLACGGQVQRVQGPGPCIVCLQGIGGSAKV